MYSPLLPVCLLHCLTASSPAVATGTQPSAPVGVVCHVKVLSDKVPDVSSLEAWKKSYIKEGMSDKEKADLAPVVAGSKVTLEQGLATSKKNGKPVSAKFEIENEIGRAHV